MGGGIDASGETGGDRPTPSMSIRAPAFAADSSSFSTAAGSARRTRFAPPFLAKSGIASRAALALS